MSIANGIGFNAALEKSIGPTIVGLGFFQQSYIENFDYTSSESEDLSFTFKKTTSTNYAMGYVIYPYEIDPLRVWGGLQFGQCLSGTSTLKPARQDLEDYEDQYLRRQGQRPTRKPAETRPTSSSCNSCGKPLKPAAKFCGKCGTKR